MAGNVSWHGYWIEIFLSLEAGIASDRMT